MFRVAKIKRKFTIQYLNRFKISEFIFRKKLYDHYVIKLGDFSLRFTDAPMVPESGPGFSFAFLAFIMLHGRLILLS